jgi:hypothetical protein
VEQNIRNVNILLTCADNRNDDETSTFMDGGPSNRVQGPELTACLVGLQSHSRLHRGHCSTRTDPKYVGSLVCTEFSHMNVGYTNSFSIHFFCQYLRYCTYRISIPTYILFFLYGGPKYVGSLVCT